MSDQRSGLGNRMDGDYQPPVLTEPQGGPIPETPDPEEDDTAETDPAE